MPPPSHRYIRSHQMPSGNTVTNPTTDDRPSSLPHRNYHPPVFGIDDVDPSDSLDELLLGPRPQRHAPIDELAIANASTEETDDNGNGYSTVYRADRRTPELTEILELAGAPNSNTVDDPIGTSPGAWFLGMRAGRAVLPYPPNPNPINLRPANPPWRQPRPPALTTATTNTILPQPSLRTRPRIRQVPSGLPPRSSLGNPPPPALFDTPPDAEDTTIYPGDLENQDGWDSNGEYIPGRSALGGNYTGGDAEDDDIDDYDEAQWDELRYAPPSTRLRREAWVEAREVAAERRRLRYGMYRHGNDSEVELNRGGNNRRRERGAGGGVAVGIDDVEGIQGEEGRVDVTGWFLGSEWMRRGIRAAGPREDEVVLRSIHNGLSITNTELDMDEGPLLVRTSGVRRQREEDAAGGRLRSKRRKFEHQHADSSKDDIKPPQFPSSHPTRPSYLQYTSLPLTTPLPTKFTAPTPSSNLVLTTYHSPHDPSRPIITFSPLPQETSSSRYINPPHPDSTASALRTTEVIPIGCGVYYYEAKVLCKGEEGYMSIGFMEAGCGLGRLVGWDKGSWGWHGDDGRSFGGEAKGKVFGETWGDGDTVGCGVDFTTGRAFFTKNGKMIGHVFNNLSSGLHPAIGLRTPGESLSVNLTGPFTYDIDTYVKHLRDEVWGIALSGRKGGNNKVVGLIPQAFDGTENVWSVLSDEWGTVNLIDEDEGENEGGGESRGRGLAKLAEHSVLRDGVEKNAAGFVLDYLRHNGHEKTLRALKGEMVKREWVPSNVVLKDTSPLDFILQNYDYEDVTLTDFSSKDCALIWLEESLRDTSIPIPTRLINDFSPGRWEGVRTLTVSGDVNAELQRILRVERYVRLLRSNLLDEEEGLSESVSEAIDFGKRLLAASVSEEWDEKSKRELKVAFGLLAIEVKDWDGDGRKERREEFVKDFMGAIRRELRMKERSYLEQAVRQSLVVQKSLNEVDGMSGFVNVGRLVKRGDTAGGEEVKGEVGVKIEGE